MGDIKTFKDNPHVDTYIKYLIFWAIPTDIILWVLESWSLHTTLKNNMEVFLQRH